MLVLDPDGRPCLAGESADGVLVLDELREKKLDGDEVVEVEVPRGDDDPHAPDADDALDAVASRERIAGLHGTHLRNTTHDRLPA